MYHFIESDLNIKTVAQLKDVYVQLGCTEVITDKRIKANWVQAILTHQSALVEKVTVAEVAQLLLQPKIEEQQAASNLTENLPKGYQPSISTNVQSGLLIFKPVGCAQAYEVWNGDTKYGAIRMLEDGLWLQSYAPVTTKYGTPYAAAAALVEAAQSRQARSTKSAGQNLLPGEFRAKLRGESTLSPRLRTNIQVIENWGDKFVVRNIQNGCYYVVQPNHPDPQERCECGDCHFRSVICKHQNAVEEHIKIESLSNDIEVDSVSDPDFGLLYRVWKSWELLGTFYHALDGKWVAQPCESDARETRRTEDSVRQISRPRCETANQAQLLILAMAGMLVAGEVEEDLEVPVI